MTIEYCKKDSIEELETIKDVCSVSTVDSMGRVTGKLFIYYRDNDGKSQCRFISLDKYDFRIY